MAELPQYFYFRVKSNGLNIQIEDASDADVVEVVRCKNCIHCREVDKLWEFYCDKCGSDVPENHFCGYGEAK